MQCPRRAKESRHLPGRSAPSQGAEQQRHPGFPGRFRSAVCSPFFFSRPLKVCEAAVLLANRTEVLPWSRMLSGRVLLALAAAGPGERSVPLPSTPATAHAVSPGPATASVQQQQQKLLQASEARSPLGMITDARALTSLIGYLQDMRMVIEKDPDASHCLEFSRSQIEDARADFEAALRQGERKQHALCSLFGQRLLGAYYTQSVVVGELPRTKHRFELSQLVETSTLLSDTDLNLGNRVLAQHRVLSNGQWVNPSLVASFVEYHPTMFHRQEEDEDAEDACAPPLAQLEDLSDAGEEKDWAIFKMISRIKAEQVRARRRAGGGMRLGRPQSCAVTRQEIFNKVCDEIFDFDALVREFSDSGDKQLAAMSYYVKDVFGIKLVVGSAAQARALQEDIRNLRFTSEDLSGIPIDGPLEKVHLLEVKDHLGASRKSRSGWECLKSVFEWNGSLFELQIQPLINYCLERERLTKQSHAAFKQKREDTRDKVRQRPTSRRRCASLDHARARPACPPQVASKVPLFGFYRELLRTLFVEPPVCDGLTIPQFGNVKVDIRE